MMMMMSTSTCVRKKTERKPNKRRSTRITITCTSTPGKRGGAAAASAAPEAAREEEQKLAAGAARAAAGAASAGAQVSSAEGEASPFLVRNARLVLEDGSVWRGFGFGDMSAPRTAEVVFNTSLTGYQEIMSDPSYKGQLVVFTCPHIGNVGANADDMESSICHMEGIVVHSLSPVVSNYRAEEDLESFCMRQGLIGLAGVDTRGITMRVREKGSLVGVVCGDDAGISDEELLEKAKQWSIEGKDLITTVTTGEAYQWSETTDAEWEFSDPVLSDASNTKAGNGAAKYRVTAIDFGIKRNILRRLASYGCDVTVLPASVTAEEVLATNPDGIFLSNGPGDPSAVPYAVETVRGLIGRKPIFGICMGHQILSQALGATTFKLKFGHHGGNHPVRREQSGRVEISAQNHNYAVDVDTLPPSVDVSHINLNDRTCSGITDTSLSAFGIQYHPESSPGPHDADPCFAYFIEMMRTFEDKDKKE